MTERKTSGCSPELDDGEKRTAVHVGGDEPEGPQASAPGSPRRPPVGLGTPLRSRAALSATFASSSAMRASRDLPGSDRWRRHHCRLAFDGNAAVLADYGFVARPIAPLTWMPPSLKYQRSHRSPSFNAEGPAILPDSQLSYVTSKMGLPGYFDHAIPSGDVA